MTENGTGQPPADADDSALRPAESDLHPADAVDDLSASTSGGAAPAVESAESADGGWPDEGAMLPPDSTPGDGTVDERPDTGDADSLRTAVHGRGSGAATTSDTAPTPTETPTPGAG